MTLLTILWWSLAISLWVPFIQSTVALGGTLLAVALIATLTVGTTLHPWCGFTLFLIYITSVLVLFGYLLAVNPNDKVTTIWDILSAIAAMSVFSAIMYKADINLFLPKPMITPFPHLITKIFEESNIPIYWFVATILFLTLLMVVTMCYKSPRPLRGFLPH